MPVLLATVLLGLVAPSLHENLADMAGELGLLAVAGFAVNHFLVIFNSQKPAPPAEQDVDLKKNPSKQEPNGSLSESLSISAGAGFAYCAYNLLLSHTHRINFAMSREKTTYLQRLAILTPFQLLCIVGMGLCVLVLFGCAGMTFEDYNASKMSKTESWCVVAFVVQGLALVYLSLLHTYRAAFHEDSTAESNIGLMWGLTFAGVGQVCVLTFHYLRRELGWLRPNLRLQHSKPYSTRKSFVSQVYRHVAKPSSLFMIGAYLILTWVLKLMPTSYYRETDCVDWSHVVAQLLVVDVFTYINHRAEHVLVPLYISSHKPHHRFTNPNVFDAFDGSVADTLVLILLPLFATSQLCTFVSCWSYVAFGFVYSTHFMLIHSEWACPFDNLASKLGIYVASDHHVHHSRFLYNYGHFFTFWDRMMGTYEEL